MAFLAQPAPALPPPEFGDRPSGIYPKQAPEPGWRIPRIFVIPLGPIAAAGVVFGILYFWSDNDAPAWASELNPITREPYTSLGEFRPIVTPSSVGTLILSESTATRSQITQPSSPRTCTARGNATTRRPRRICLPYPANTLLRNRNAANAVCISGSFSTSKSLSDISSLRRTLPATVTHLQSQKSRRCFDPDFDCPCYSFKVFLVTCSA